VTSSIADPRRRRKPQPSPRRSPLGRRRPEHNHGHRSRDVPHRNGTRGRNANRQDVAAALYSLGPSYLDDDRRWPDVGRALWTWDRTETTLALWTAWSTKGGRRTAAECRKQWSQFGHARRSNSVTIEDLFDWATECGWEPTEKTGKSGGPQGGAWALAEQLLEGSFLQADGEIPVLTLRHYRGDFHKWRSGRYVVAPVGEIRNALVRFVSASGYNLTPMLISAVLDSIRAQTEVPAEKETPCWLDEVVSPFGEIEEPPIAPEDLIAARNGLVDVRAFLAGRPCLLPATPRFFCLSAVEFDFVPEGKKPSRWHKFIEELWPEDKTS
jgi:hypothetical protein